MRTQTTQKRVQFARALRGISLRVFAVFVLVFALFASTHQATTSAATPTLNFQARLENSAGAIAPDGNYNIEFKLYQGGTTTGGGTLKWTEDWLNSASNGVHVANGYLTVNLGSITSFPGTINWDADLFLSMNIGNTNVSCTPFSSCVPDGEMTPYLKLTSVPYAFQAQSASQLQVIQGSYTGNLSFDTLSANRAILLPDANGTVCLTTGNCVGVGGSGDVLQGGNSFGTTMSLGTNDAQDLVLETNNTPRFTITSGGAATFASTVAVQGTSITVGGSSIQGQLILNSGGGFTTTLKAGASATNISFTLPTADGSGNQCLKTNGSGQLQFANCNNGSGSGGSVTLQDAYNSGNTITTTDTRDIIFTSADTATDASVLINLQCATCSVNGGRFAVQNAGTDVLVVQPNNGGINLNQNVTVAASKTITLTGGATGSRPASPTEGTLYYDTSTHHLLVYNAGKTNGTGTGSWQADRTDTVLVAASDSSQADKDAADYIVDGDTAAANDGDQVQINAALTAAAGKKVVLLAGTYTVDAAVSIPNNTILAGVGRGTVVKLGTNVGTMNAIANSDITTGAGVTVRDLKLDGNKTNNSSGTQSGVSFDHVGDTTTNRAGGTIMNVEASNFRSYGILIGTSAATNVIGNTTNNNGSTGIVVSAGAYNTVTNNTANNNTAIGIWLNFTNNNSISNNSTTANGAISNGGNIYLLSSLNNVLSNNIVASSANAGIFPSASSYNTITSNTITGNLYGIYLYSGSNNNSVSLNNLNNNGGTTANYAITTDGSDSNTITNNTITDGTGTTNCSTTCYAVNIANAISDTNYLADNTLGNGTINDAGTGTIYGGQLNASSAFVLQASGGISLNSATTISANLTVTNAGNVAFQKGTDYSTTGTTNNVNFGTGVLFRLTGASAQTITGIAGGVNGRILTLVNAASQTAILKNNDTVDSSAANVIITGTGADLSIAAGASVSLVYDSGSSVWRVIGTVAGGGSGGSYVTLQGSTPGTADTGNFNITGTGIAATLQGSTTILSPALDTISAGTLSVGTATATAVSIGKTGATTTVNGALTVTQAATFNSTVQFNDNVTVAANKTITLTGGATGLRPASPTEGTLFYDTTTKQLLVYANGKWQADRESNTKIIAPSNASQAAKDAADVVLTGTADQTLINTALTAAAGGKVYIMEGTVTVTGSISVPNNTTLAGAGRGTLITIPNSHNAALNMIVNTDTTTGTGVTVQDIRLDGNNTGQASGLMDGVHLTGMGSGSGTAAVPGARLINLWVTNMTQDGISLNTSSNNTVTASTSQNNSCDGIYLATTTNSTIANNISQGNGCNSIDLSSSSNNTITGNTAQGNGDDFWLTGSSNNTITGNVAQGPGTSFTMDSGSSHNTLTGNTAQSDLYGFSIDATSPNNTITGNTISGTAFDGVHTESDGTVISSNLIDGNSRGIYSSGRSSITGNTISGSTGKGIWLDFSSNVTVTGNTISTNMTGGVYLSDTNASTISGNTFVDNGSNTENEAIIIETSDSNNITGNTISDGSCTTTCYAINISGAASDTNYLADNSLGGGSINDAGTGTIYGGQVNSSGNFVIQPAGTIELMKNTNVTGSLTVKTSTATDDSLKLSVTTGGANAFTGTLTATDLTANRTWTLPDQDGTVCLSTNNCTGLGAYIQNQNAGQQAASNFWISGTGRADTSFTTPLIDTPTSGVLNVGTTNATQINLNKNVVVAANQSLTLTGGATGSRPASPTEGTLFYDTTTKQLLVYANGKWQADRESNTKIIAPSNASQAAKDAADVVLTGTADQTLINTALTAAAGGKVYIMEGTVTVTGSISVPNNTTLAGAGRGTLITIPASLNTSTNLITNTTTGGSGTGVTIRNLQLDGNKANQTTGNYFGVYMDGMGAVGSGTLTGVHGAILTDLWIKNFEGSTYASLSYQGGGIALINTANTTVSNTVVTSATNTGATGFYLSSSSSNTFTNNTTQGNFTGIFLGSSAANTFTGNTIEHSPDWGVNLEGTSPNNTFTGNTFRSNYYSIALYGGAASPHTTITGNTFMDTAGESDWYIDVQTAKNIITGNSFQHVGYTGTGIGFMAPEASYNVVSSNTFDGAWNGIGLWDGHDNIISNNTFTESGDTTHNGAISISGSNTNSITGNVITDTTHTTDNYAIDISSGTSNYLADNSLGGGSIRNNGTGTIYGGQVNSSGNFVIQPAGTVELMKSTNVTGDLTVKTSTATDDSLKLSVTTGGANAFTGTITSTDLTAARTWTLPDASGTICVIGSSSCAATGGFVQFAAGGAQTDATTNSSIFINKTGASGNIVTLQSGGTSIFTIGNAGDLVIGTVTNNVTFASGSSFEPILNGSARHTKKILLTPEYAGATLDAASDSSCSSANSGTMTSGYDSTNRTNYYDWTSTQGTAQCYDVVVQVPIPSDWSAWSATPINVQMKKDSTGTAAYAIQVINSSGSSDTTFCATTYCSPGTIATTWGNMTTSNAFAGSGYTAGDYLTIKVRMSSLSSANTYLGNITLTYLSKY